MSGIEVAGLVLGALPIVIWGLDQYKSTREILRRFRSKALLVDRLVDALEEQRLFMEIDLQLLLRAADIGDGEISALDHSKVYVMLRDPDVVEALTQYLGPIYEPYQKALLRCLRILADIARNLFGLTVGGQHNDDESLLLNLIRANADNDQSSQWRQASKRIKFALNKEELDGRISELDASTNMLTRLRINGDLLKNEITQASTSRGTDKLVKFLSQIQRHAEHLYNAIGDRISTRCHASHRTQLHLENRLAALQKKQSRVRFRIRIVPISSSATNELWRYAEVEVHEEENNMKGDFDLSSTRGTENPSKIRFQLPEPKGGPKATKVQDLCAALRQGSSDQQSLKLHLSENGSLLSEQLPDFLAKQETSSGMSKDFITLDRIIQEEQSSKAGSKRWTLNQRMLLAYRLASSLLEFHTTPWLKDSWKKQGVCFLYKAEPGTSHDATTCFEANEPFIMQDFPPNPAESGDKPQNAKVALLELGILLLEIWHIASFEQYAANKGFAGESTYGSRYDLAHGWLLDTYENMVPLYADSVCRCIEGSFASDSPMFDWSDRQLQRSICENVVKPLWDNCSGKRAYN